MDRPESSRVEHRAAMRPGAAVPLGLLLRADARKRRELGAAAADRRAVHTNAVLWRAEADRLVAEARLGHQSEARPSADARPGRGGDLSETAAVAASARPSDLSVPAPRVDDHASGS